MPLPFPTSPGRPARQVPAVDARDLFEILVRENIDSVRALLLASVRDNAAAEDLIQETFLVAWKQLDKYDRQLPFGPWVRGIASKLVLNWRRKQARHKVVYCDEEVLGVVQGRFDAFDRMGGDTFDDRLEELRQCMGQLTERQTQAIQLHYDHGLHCKEIARRLDLGVEAVKKHLQRGRAVLHRCLDRKMDTENQP